MNDKNKKEGTMLFKPQQDFDIKMRKLATFCNNASPSSSFFQISFDLHGSNPTTSITNITLLLQLYKGKSSSFISSWLIGMSSLRTDLQLDHSCSTIPLILCWDPLYSTYLLLEALVASALHPQRLSRLLHKPIC